MNIRWQNGINAMLGVWLIASPGLLGFHGSMIPMRNSIFVGIAILIISSQAIAQPETWEEIVSAILAVWLISSPLLSSFRGPAIALYNNVIVGSAIAILALWTVLRSQRFRCWRHLWFNG